jgi:Flp pilus assembly protein TadD
MGTVPDAVAAAIAHQQAGRLQEAEQIYRQILAVDPNNAGVWHLLGAVAYQTGKFDVAAEVIGRAVQLAPRDASMHNSLGAALEAQGKLDDAAASLRRALELEPGLAVAHYNLGNVCRGRGHFDEAIACYRRALDLRPGYAEAYNNLGVALNSLGHESEAAQWYRRALDVQPNYAEAHTNLGLALYNAGNLVDAAWHYRRAIELRPDYAWAHWNRSLLLLLTGDLEHGWSEYEWRWQARLPLREFERPKWTGDSLAGRTILLHAEQGLGDTLQFFRYAALVKGRGAKVILECQPVLEKLLAGCPGVDRLVAAGEQLPPFDVHAPLLSLPGILKTSMASIPANVPYVFADDALIALWRDTLDTGQRFRIGINWHGRPGRGHWRERDIPLECFASLGQVPNVQLISLQRGEGQLQLPRSGLPIIDLGEDVDTVHGAFMDSAAIMRNLDLVITSDTSVPHLAGALGVPVWVALPFVPDWRWLLDRSDSPWYPTMRLFRQKSPGDWTSVFQEMSAALQGRLDSEGGKEVGS